MTIIGGCLPPPRIVNSPLTETEMEVTPGRYQNLFNIAQNQQVEYFSSEEKPHVEWVFTPNEPGDIREPLVDGDGNTWFSISSPKPPCYNKILRINQYGNVNLTINLSKYSGPEIPVLISKGAIIFRCYYKGMDLENVDSTLECYDLNGNLRWRSNPLSFMLIKRISNNRLLFTKFVLGGKSKFQIVSLSDGSFLDSFSFPQWYEPYLPIFPFEILDDSWIILTKPKPNGSVYISRIKSDNTVIWEYDTESDKWKNNFQITKTGYFLIGSGSSLIALNIENGKQIWKWQNNEIYYPLGVDCFNNYIVYKHGENPLIMLVDTQGKIIWTIPIAPFYDGLPVHIIAYKDGEILLGDKIGLKQLNQSGHIKWELDYTELNFMDVELANLNPTINNRLIVFLYSKNNSGEIREHIVSIAQK